MPPVRFVSEATTDFNGVKASGDKTRAVPLDIARELDKRGVAGEVSLKVEGVPNGAGLSAGRNNWDGTWSLTAADLSDIRFLPPEGDDAARTLAIRVLRIDSDGFNVATTVALFDLEVKVPRQAPGNKGPGAASGDGAPSREMAAAQAAWEKESERRLASAKEAWQGEADERLAAAKKAWAADTEKRIAAALDARRNEERALPAEAVVSALVVPTAILEESTLSASKNQPPAWWLS